MLVPYTVDVPMERVPIANWLLIGLTSLVSILILLHWHTPEKAELSDDDIEALKLAAEKNGKPLTVEELREIERREQELAMPPLSLRWSRLTPVYLFSYQFVHADLLHLIGNMIFLFCFGNAVNAKLGHWQFLVTYLLLGAVAGLAWLPFSSGQALVGASGAIMGIVGTFVVLFPRNDVQVFYWFGIIWAGVTRIAAYWVVAFFVVCDLIGVLLDRDSPVAYVAHLVGAAAGFGLGIVLVKSGFVRSTRYEENLLEALGYRPKPKERRARKRKSERRPAPTRTLAQLLPNGSDFDICDAVFRRVLRRHGNEVDAAGLRDEERVVVLVWHTKEIIDNGGFRSLFERAIPGDPHLQQTVAAYRDIGAQRAWRAFRKALARFPNSRPSRDIEDRLGQYLQQLPGLPAAEDREFFQAGDEVEHCLVEYIRAHGDFFLTLDHSPEVRVMERPRDRGSGDGRVDCGRLTHWARVAFAARCARRVQPLFEASWPAAPARHAHAVTAAADLTEEAATDGRTPDGLKEAVVGARLAANAALDREDKAAPLDARASRIASLAVKVAERAASAARLSADGSAAPAQEAWEFACKAAAEADDEAVVRALKEDFARLRLAMARGRWTDRTVVPPVVFEAAWD